MPSARRTLLIAGGALLATVVIGVGATAALAGDEVPRGTTVRAVEIGGLSRAEAVERLSGSFEADRAASVELVTDDEVLTLEPSRAGLELDADATVEDALDVGLFRRIGLLVGGGRDVDAVPSVDEAALTAELTLLAEGFDREPREGSIAFSDEAVPVETLPETGRELDLAGAATAVRENYLVPRIEVPSEVTAVQTTAEDVRQAVTEIAEPAMADSIAVTAAGGTVTVEPLDLAVALTIQTDDDGVLAPRLDAEELADAIGDRMDAVGTAPVDATFTVESGTPVVVASQDGTSISPADLAAAVQQVLTDPAPRTVEAPLTPSSPRVTTEIAGALGVIEPLGSFTSGHPCCAPRVTNIHRIADILDGYVLLPGEQFDLNDVVGRRDLARGFVAAPQILEGEFVDSVGGGISQFTTALFNAVFFSGLKDIAHSPHSYYISRYPAGRESTVSFPQPDFIFENDTPNGVLIKAAYTGTSITVTFWGTKRFDEVRSLSGPRTRVRDSVVRYDERAVCSSTRGGQGFDITVTRVFMNGGAEVAREDFNTRYLPQPRVICGPPPAPAPEPTPTAAPTPTASPAS